MHLMAHLMSARFYILLFNFIFIVQTKHFNGGTINWAAVDPYSNASTLNITITQTYFWTYPKIKCVSPVPGASGYSNSKLICVVDCSTSGGYNSTPITIATDCISVDSALNMLTSQRTNTIALAKDTHFYLANVGSAWTALNDPANSSLQWSIVTFIDLRKRPDGFINTPPVARVVSPQYVFVNTTMTIKIPVSDANAGDDIRCRWSTYTTGYRRRRDANHGDYTTHHSILEYNERLEANLRIARENYNREKRDSCIDCGDSCGVGCCCSSTGCQNAGCTGSKCSSGEACATYKTTSTTSTTRTTTTTTRTTTTTTRTTTTTTRTTTTTTTTVATTAFETSVALQSTISYPTRQAIDECGGICYPGSLPKNTTLSDCTITITAPKVGIWYGVAIQVEDFIDNSSTTPLSSVPVQLLVYVLPQPLCKTLPVILPLTRCLEVQVGVTITFQIYAMHNCSRSISNLTSIVVSSGASGVTAGNLTSVPTNSTLFYVTITWTPQIAQIGYEEICAIVYTSEMAQSEEYCALFTVKNSSDLCVTTTTTATSTTATTSTTTTSTSTTTSTTTTLSTTTTSTTTTETTTTTTRTTSTTTTSTTTSTSTTTTSTTSTTTTSTTTTSTTTTTTSTTTTTTSVTTTTVTTVTTVAKSKSGSSVNWLLITGLSLLFFLMTICCCCFCLYCCLWAPAARRRRRRHSEDTSKPKRVLGPRKLRYQRFKEWLLNRVYRRKSSANDRLVDRATSFAESNASKFTVDVTDAQTIVTDVDEDTTSRQGVSVTKVKRAAVDSAASNNQELKDIESERKRSASSVGKTTIRIGPSKKLPSIEESETIQRKNIAVNTERVKSVKVDRVRKLPSATLKMEMNSLSAEKTSSVSVTTVRRDLTSPKSSSSS